MSKKVFLIRKPKLSIEGLYNKPLSAIIRIAVNDLQTNVANGAGVNMELWGRRNGDCVGCLAGHCLLPYTKRVVFLIDKNNFACDVAFALNWVRSGALFNAVTYLYDDITKLDKDKIYKIMQKGYVRYWNTRSYNLKPKLFITCMLKIAAALEKAGF